MNGNQKTVGVVFVKNAAFDIDGILTLESATIHKYPGGGDTILIELPSTAVEEFVALEDRTLKELTGLVSEPDAKKAFKKVFDAWAEYRAKYRNGTMIRLPYRNVVQVIDIDNLYVSRQTIGASIVLWTGGVTNYDILNRQLLKAGAVQGYRWIGYNYLSTWK